MAMHAAEAQEMVATAREAEKVLTIGYGWRFSAVAQAIHRRIVAGDLGEIYHAEATCLRQRGVPSWGAFTSKRVSGGGPLIARGACSRPGDVADGDLLASSSWNVRDEAGHAIAPAV